MVILHRADSDEAHPFSLTCQTGDPERSARVASKDQGLMASQLRDYAARDEPRRPIRVADLELHLPRQFQRSHNS
jgi:hypothetical protein